LAAAGVVGFGCVAAVSHAPRLRLVRRFGALRDVGDAWRSGGGAAILHAIAAGLQAAALPVVALAAAMLAAFYLGAATGLRGGPLLGSMTALQVMLASGPYLFAVGCFGPIADSARRVAVMGSAAVSTDAERRAARLGEAGAVASSVSHTYLTLASGLAAVLAALALLALRRGTDPMVAVELGKPAVLWSGALGAGAVLWYAGNVTRAATRGAQQVAGEVERQLGGFPRERGALQIPRDYTPSYRQCIDVAARAARRGLLPAALLPLLLPAALAGVLAAVYHGLDPALPRAALSAFVSVAAVTGIVVALAVDTTRGLLSAARRGDRPRGSQPEPGASTVAAALAGVMGSAAGPAAPLLVKATALSALAVAPFLF